MSLDDDLAGFRTAELSFQREMTHAFIAAAPVEVTLTPRTKVTTSAGGRTWQDGTARAPQYCALIPMGESVEPVRTVDGVERKIDYMLLGEYDAVMEVNDTFIHDGGRFELVAFLPSNDYEIRALACRHGA